MSCHEEYARGARSKLKPKIQGDYCGLDWLLLFLFYVRLGTRKKGTRPLPQRPAYFRRFNLSITFL